MAIASKPGLINKIMITVITIAVIISAEIQVAKSVVICNPVELELCLPSVTDPSKPPLPQCCNNLKVQESCFCLYLQNPVYAKYINSPGGKRVAAACGVTIPTKCN